MEIRVLRYFLAVAKDQTISGAAKRLNVTQPTLSRQLQDLERELGTQLLIRGSGSRRVTLTEEGVLLRQRAEEIVDLVDRTEGEVRSAEESVAGIVSVGVSEYGSVPVVAQTSAEVRRRYPKVNFKVSAGEVQEILYLLDQGSVELAILPSTVDVARYDSKELSQKNRWGVLVPRDNPLASSSVPVTPERLSEEDLVLTNPHHMDTMLGKWLGGSFADAKVAFTCNVPVSVPEVVAGGLGVAPWLEGSGSTFGPNVVFRPLTPSVEIGFRAVWKRAGMLSRASTTFLDCLNNH